MEPAQDHSIYDVIISGAGPVGLFLACELALGKCSVLILEKAENPQSPSDGIVAWASDNGADCNELQKAVARWF